MPTSAELARRIREEAHRLGIDTVGFAPAIPLIEHGQKFLQWLSNGLHGQMTWLERTATLRANPQELLEGAKSVVCVFVPHAKPVESVPRGAGRVAAYAYGKDYHKELRKRLVALGKQVFAPHERFRVFVDSSPILERAYAQLSGIGFIGRNHALISQNYGSFGYLGVLLTQTELEPDQAQSTFSGCDGCTQCIKACPTGALKQDGTFDARRCISYLTIEYNGVIPAELATRIGDRIFGCDTCQIACPYNHSPSRYVPPDWTDQGLYWIDLNWALSTLTDEEVRSKFAGTPIRRLSRCKLVRNAILVAANLGINELKPQIERLAKTDSSETVRHQAKIALEVWQG